MQFCLFPEKRYVRWGLRKPSVFLPRTFSAVARTSPHYKFVDRHDFSFTLVTSQDNQKGLQRPDSVFEHNYSVDDPRLIPGKVSSQQDYLSREHGPLYQLCNALMR